MTYLINNPITSHTYNSWEKKEKVKCVQMDENCKEAKANKRDAMI
jgi:hypothetical protein